MEEKVDSFFSLTNSDGIYSDYERSDMQRLISIDSAARQTGLSKSTIRRYIKAGSLAIHRVGPKLIRISQAELNRFLGISQNGSVSSEI